MKKQGKILLVVLWTISVCYGQDLDKDVAWDSPRPQDSAYYELRERLSIPSFGLTKIKKLKAERLKTVPQDYALTDYDAGISVEQFNSLTTEEKFTYVMLHPEVYSQACAERMYVFDPQNKIFGHLPAIFMGEYWSKRQMDFMKANRSKIIDLIKESVTSQGEFGLNYKDALTQLDAWEAIPFIINYYRKNMTDKDALTILLLLLCKEEDAFKETKIYKRLYSDDNNYESWINASQANEAYILATAREYYVKRKGEN